MEEKKRLTLNCEVCDFTRIKEENYRHYEEIMVNAEIFLVNEVSKGLLNRLPVRLNIERMVEIAEEPEIKIVNRAYEITAGKPPQKPVVLIVNDFLKVWPGTEEILKRYACVVINGTAEFPESLRDFVNEMTVNGQVRTYPDDSVILEEDFVMDPFFPVRAREGMRYFARNAVIVPDAEVDIARLIQKKVKILTPRLIVPESRLEECAVLFDARVDFVVVPEGLSLVYGDAVMDEELIRRKGGKLFVYGNLKLDGKVDMDMLQRELETLTVTGRVTLDTDQKEGFQKIHADYRELQVLKPEGQKKERVLQGMAVVRLNKKLFDCSPDGIRIGSAVKVVIEEDVTPEMLLNGLNGIHCLQIECSEEQENALYAMGVAPGLIQDHNTPEASEVTPVPPMPMVPDANQVINAECYVM